jgi:hypothetical protein
VVLESAAPEPGSALTIVPWTMALAVHRSILAATVLVVDGGLSVAFAFFFFPLT